MITGLVLEGGGMRGMFTAGVLDALMGRHIEIDKIIGVSAGALFGINYASNQKERALRYNLKYLKDKRYMGFHSLFTTGNIVNKDFAFYDLPFNLDPFDQNEFEKSHIDFYLAATNIENGKAEYFKIENVFKEMEYFRATSAMPFVSQFVEINGQKYLDGGIADSIPFEKAQELGCDKIIVVLTQPIENRYRTYNEQVEEIIRLEKQNKIFVIRPNVPLNIGRLERDETKIRTVYELGEKILSAQIQDLKKYLTS
ncbi:MAG: patatin family protein [Haemophilus parainfluenzae]|nr:patatin family protein [Haemophilus parainfluenzae]